MPFILFSCMRYDNDSAKIPFNCFREHHGEKIDRHDGSGGIPIPPSSAPQPESLPTAPVTLAALDDQPIAPLPQEVPAPSFACEIALTATVQAAAIVELSLAAPCLPEERFTLHHNGMMFSAVTDAEGNSTWSVPAMAENAVFIATFAEGETAVASAQVSTLEYYDRIVVQWGGPDALQIHALEYGADYGEAGHIWSQAAGEMAMAARGEGGFLTRLGDGLGLSPQTAEIYTFPTATALRDGTISMTVEAVVTAANCGQDVDAQVMKKSGANPLQAHDLQVSMPDCDGIGDILVLKNLFDDLNIARNN